MSEQTSIFKTHTLEGVMEAIIDYRGKTPKKTDKGIPLVTAKIVKAGRIREPAEFIAEEDYDSWMVRGLPQVGDVVLTTEAPLGEVAQLTDNRIALAQRIVTLRSNPEILENDYLRYLLQSKPVQNELQARATGSTVKGIKQKELRLISLSIPDLGKQKYIAKILKDLDDKIELNRKTNETLEAMAQAIFKSWFVDFEPTRAKIAAIEAGEDPELAAMAAISGKPISELSHLTPEQTQQLKSTAALFPNTLQDSELGEIPEGWEVGTLNDLINFAPKRSLKKGILAPYVEMKAVPTSGHIVDGAYDRQLTSGTKFKNGDTLLARITPCLENGKTAYIDFLKDQEIGWGSTEFIVMSPQKNVPSSFVYFMARRREFRAIAEKSMTGSSGRQRANAKSISEHPWVLYPTELLNEFRKFANKAIATASSNSVINFELKSIRDSLLPKLLSGEIELTEIT